MSSAVSDNLESPERLGALRDLFLLDTGPEEPFDRLTRLATRLLHAPVSLVSLVDTDREFFKSACGLNEPWAAQRETPLSHSFGQHVVANNEPLIVEDARFHRLVSENPAVHDMGIIAYLGIPLQTRDGHVLGSFCVIDHQPHPWTPAEIAIVRDLAAGVMTEIELRSEVLARRRAEEMLREAYVSVEDQVNQRTEVLQHALQILQSEIAVRSRIERTQERLIALVEATTDVIWVADMEDRIISVNSAARQFFDLHDAVKKRLNVDSFLHEEAFHYLRSEALRHATEHTIWTGDLYFQRHDGENVPVSVIVLVHRDDDGNPEFWSLIARDITFLRDMEHRLQQAVEREQHIVRLQARFISTMTKELRSPVAMILSSLETLQRHGARTDPKSHYERMRKEVKEIAATLDRGLKLLDETDDEVEPSVETVTLAEFAQEMTASAIQDNEERVITVEAPQGDSRVQVDTAALRLIAQYLLSNALKFSTTSAAVTLRLMLRDCEGDICQLVMHVRDRGVGIPDDDQPFIFERFYRAYNQPNVPGLGIGLYRVRRLVERLNGRIEFFSRVGEGSEFVILIPVQMAPIV